jgi:hypothetical protein
MSDTHAKKNLGNSALKLSKIYSTNSSALANIPASQKAGGVHSQSVQQFAYNLSSIKDLKVPKKEAKLNYQFKNALN